MRLRLADTLRWVISQRLAPKSGGGRHAVPGDHGLQPPHQGEHRLGESEGKSFYEIIEASYPFGWRTFDHSCYELHEQGLISEETALLHCTKRGALTRAIDLLKKKRGERNAEIARLHMQQPSVKANPTPTNPANLKLK